MKKERSLSVYRNRFIELGIINPRHNGHYAKLCIRVIFTNSDMKTWMSPSDCERQKLFQVVGVLHKHISAAPHTTAEP